MRKLDIPNTVLARIPIQTSSEDPFRYSKWLDGICNLPSDEPRDKAYNWYSNRRSCNPHQHTAMSFRVFQVNSLGDPSPCSVTWAVYQWTVSKGARTSWRDLQYNTCPMVWWMVPTESNTVQLEQGGHCGPTQGHPSNKEGFESNAGWQKRLHKARVG